MNLFIQKYITITDYMNLILKEFPSPFVLISNFLSHQHHKIFQGHRPVYCECTVLVRVWSTFRNQLLLLFYVCHVMYFPWKKFTLKIEIGMIHEDLKFDYLLLNSETSDTLVNCWKVISHLNNNKAIFSEKSEILTIIIIFL